MRIILALFFGLLVGMPLTAQRAGYWQQAVDYTMDIDMDVEKNQYAGRQTLIYTNNSPDTLYQVFYHLYFNAFQPNSMMDVRSRTILDPDPRVGARIEALSADEIGYQRINSLTQDGLLTEYEVVGTILEVQLAKPILPNSSATFVMNFNAQVPLQIRRSGRDSKEGIRFSMSQWYPKMCEYDEQGWHANPYIGREFHGVWGNYQVNITIDKNYVLGGTGYLQNANEIGHGYQDKGVKVKHKRRVKKLTWKFYAPNVHDFFWGADPDYTHTMLKRKDGIVMHFLYQKTEENAEVWEALPGLMDHAFDFINKTYGQYPYKQYSFVQGGDGGMEYPMGTLITGNRQLGSLLGTAIHELMHAWYHTVLATNESLYAWMDEGFTSYGSTETTNYLRSIGARPGDALDNPHVGRYKSFGNFSKTGYEEALSTHADHYTTNQAHSVGVYTKGAIFMHQLEYIIGKEAFDRGLLRYYHTWKFKHPTPNDFIRVMEKESGLELDWYKEYWVNTTHSIDYAVSEVTAVGDGQTKVSLQKLGYMPMPLDIEVTYQDGSTEMYNIPLRMMRGAKAAEGNTMYTVLGDWPWTHPTYDFVINRNIAEVKSVQIDPQIRMMDVDLKNNRYEQ